MLRYPMLRERQFGVQAVQLLLFVTMISSVLACSPLTRHTVVGFIPIVGMQLATWVPEISESRFGPLGVSALGVLVFGAVVRLVAMQIKNSGQAIN